MGEAGPVDLGGMNDDMLAMVAGRFEAESGNKLRRFADLAGAESAAKARSNSGGAASLESRYEMTVSDDQRDAMSRILTSWRGGVVKKGAKSKTARALQLFLRSEGYDIRADGDFGKQTEAALKDWQAKNGLGAGDGKAGNKTFTRIREKITPVPRQRPERKDAMAERDRLQPVSGFDAMMAGAPQAEEPAPLMRSIAPLDEGATEEEFMARLQGGTATTTPGFRDLMRQAEEGQRAYEAELAAKDAGGAPYISGLAQADPAGGTMPPPAMPPQAMPGVSISDMARGQTPSPMARALIGPGGSPEPHYGPIGQLLHDAGLPSRSAVEATTGNSPLAAGLEELPPEIMAGAVPANPMRDVMLNPEEAPQFQAQPDPGANEAIDRLRNALLSRLPRARRIYQAAGY